MVNLVMDEEREHRHFNSTAFAQIGRWLMTVLIIFLGLSGPALCYIKAVEPPAE